MAALLSKSKEQIVEALSQATAAVSLGGDAGKFPLSSPTALQWAPASVRSANNHSETDALYVDEATGDDKEGDGSQAKPFKTVGGAFISRLSDTVDVRVRQPPQEGQTEGEWLPVSASAKKKGGKALQNHKNKLAKQEEARKRDEVEGAARRAAEAKRLEDAKAIVLEEPKEDAAKIKIRQAVAHRGQRVRVFAWVHRLRQQGGMTFVVLRDGTGYLQCVLSGRLVRSHRSPLPPPRLSLTVPASPLHSPRRTTPSRSRSSRLSKSPVSSTSFRKARPLRTTTS